MKIIQGARGRYYEEFEVGMVFKHAITRTVTEMDNLLFSALTYNTQPLHLDEEFSKTTYFGQRLVNSLFTLSLICGVAVTDTTLGTTMGNLGFGDVKFPKPVFIGDTIRTETEIISMRESKSRPDTGIIEFETRGYNQRGELIASARRVGLMFKKPVLQP